MTNVDRRTLIAMLGAAGLLCLAACSPTSTMVGRTRGLPPNIVLIVTDDLGVGEVGCYGQTKIRTPNIDALAARGVRFTDAYSGSPVCAPSRCTLLTGRHTGHAAIRDNRELQPEGQMPLPSTEVTLAVSLRARGYATAAIGKWGLGPPGSVGDPSRHGFDFFFGYMCQRHAHNHCPPYLYRNSERLPLPGNQAKYPAGTDMGAIYAPDLFLEESLRFVREHEDGPFFLLFATPVPHLALQVPEDSLREYRGAFEERAYDGSRGYIPHPEPRAAYAAMVTRMDRDVGQLVEALRSLPGDRDTLIIFTSDNGPTIDVGGADSGFFNSTGGLRGRKMELYEGGIRVPLIAAWTRREVVGVSRTTAAAWDLYPTIARLTGAQPTQELDGVDLSDALLGRPMSPREGPLYWEYPAGKGSQAVRIGPWKGVRRDVRGRPDAPFELYNLELDPAETTDVAASHPEIVERMRAVAASRTPASIPAWNYD